MRLVIVTGLSGAGKTQAVRCLEDLGFFCVDNLPPMLIPKFTELCRQSGGKVKRIALVIDVRGGEFFNSLSEELKNLAKKGMRYEILFLEATDEALVRRYKETRRQHPLGEEGSVLAAIRAERVRLQELRGMAHIILDTSEMSPRDLKENLTRIFGVSNSSLHLTVTILSFGYKYGIPLDADLVIDVRFLPNPNYVENLKPLTGLDAPVSEFVLGAPVTKSFLRRFSSLLKFLLPYYIKEGKTHLVTAIGCTGGQHRSVAVSERLARLLGRDYQVRVYHRDLHRARVVESA
ncbi:MAG: RNase adapter RapZ [Firmicutes bacterium]|nr:RNase adapter RapZ [Bacillota bacterium]